MSADISNKIKQLIEKFTKLRENEDINFIDCVNPDENAHTRILIELLNFDNKRYAENFIRKFLGDYIKGDDNIKIINIEYNKSHLDGFIEFSVNDENKKLIIENKIKWAVDQDRQLERYVSEVFYVDKNFLIKIEDEQTNNIIDNKIDCDKETKNTLKKSMLNKNKRELELLCLIDKFNDNKEIKSLLENEEQEYKKGLDDEIKKLIEESRNKKSEERLIKTERENIYVLYLVPNDMKEPSIYSYTTATKIFLNDDDTDKKSRFFKIEYKEIIDWIYGLDVNVSKQNLIRSIELYKTYMDKYINCNKREQFDLIKQEFSSDFQEMLNVKKQLSKEIKEEEVKEIENKIKKEIFDAIDIYIYNELYKIFSWIEEQTIRNGNYLKRKSKKFKLRFIPKNISIRETKNKKKWDDILGFEFKIYKNESIVLSLWLTHEEYDFPDDLKENRKEIFKQLIAVGIEKGDKKYKENWLQIGPIYEESIVDLMNKSKEEIENKIKNVLIGEKFKKIERCLNECKELFK